MYRDITIPTLLYSENKTQKEEFPKHQFQSTKKTRVLKYETNNQTPNQNPSLTLPPLMLETPRPPETSLQVPGKPHRHEHLITCSTASTSVLPFIVWPSDRVRLE